jgi:demethylmenaquinone methyltransferase/2-methoxy-6-polyprenyl-1,4-benzoquinol methylase
MSNGIKKLFSEVPQRYELINHILTFSLDKRWRKCAAERAAIGGGERWIDVCTGTGEMALYLLRLAPEETTVYAADFCKPMLQKAQEKESANRIRFVEADVRSLPFADNIFDLVTISFATRNINTSESHILECLKEFHRILKPGGRFVNLETSQPPSKILRRFFHIYVSIFVKIIGGTLSSSMAAYTYLSNTIPRFYTAETFSDLILNAGFSRVYVKRLTKGIVAVHEAVK